MRQTHDIKAFFLYVIPSVLSFALSGIYYIIDGFFVGNSVGDLGLSAINIAFPIVAVLQSLGTGIGMGGAICYSINQAGQREKKARECSAGALWLLLLSSILLTVLISFLNHPLLKLLGADGALLSLGEEYIAIIALGAGLQIMSTGFVPLIRNHGGSFYAMVSMIAGFLTNIMLDYLFVWKFDQGIAGAAIATVIGQGITVLTALSYLLYKKQFSLRIPLAAMGNVSASILKTAVAPFGITLAPNISLLLINRFSVSYGGDSAIAVYACIAYMICILYLIVQGVGDGSQPLISRYYGKGDHEMQNMIRRLAYASSMFLSVIGCILLYAARGNLGFLFGASDEINTEISNIMCIFLISVPFDAFNRITIAGFYATEQHTFSYLLTLLEPLFLLSFLILLPPLLGGQEMIWWSSVLAKILESFFALALKQRADKQKLRVQEGT